MKNRPDPPFLELGFYFADTPEADAFARLVETLIALGATLTGSGSAHRGSGIRGKSFASVTDKHLPEPVTVDALSLTQVLTDPDIRVVEVAMKDSIGIAQNAPELVSYVNISPEAARTDRHPLAVITEGEVFCGTLREHFARRRHEAGTAVYSRFRELVLALDPAYASITVEWPLECPTDLRRDSRSGAFRDFFVGGSYLASEELGLLQELFSGAFVEPLANGLYISSSEDFNPERRSLGAESAQWRSVDAAKLIATAGTIRNFS
jgi:hypothetical protein